MSHEADSHENREHPFRSYLRSILPPTMTAIFQPGQAGEEHAMIYRDKALILEAVYDVMPEYVAVGEPQNLIHHLIVYTVGGHPHDPHICRRAWKWVSRLTSYSKLSRMKTVARHLIALALLEAI